MERWVKGIHYNMHYGQPASMPTTKAILRMKLEIMTVREQNPLQPTTANLLTGVSTNLPDGYVFGYIRNGGLWMPLLRRRDVRNGALAGRVVYARPGKPLR
jgi:hypothetical protein